MNHALITQLERVVALSPQEPKTTEAMGLKLMEEVGEYAEAINHRLGNLPHKTLKEPPIGEAADVIQMAMCILARLYPNSTPSQLTTDLATWIRLKTDKWEAIMPQRAPVIDVPVGDTVPAVMYVDRLPED